MSLTNDFEDKNGRRVTLELGSLTKFHPAGGGFQLQMPTAEFIATYTPAKEKPYTLVEVTCDAFQDNISVKAYSNGDRWNGWVMPYFPVSEVPKLINLLPSLVLSENGTKITDPTGVEEEFWDITEINGEKVFAVGAGFWCWEISRATTDPSSTTLDDVIKKMKTEIIADVMGQRVPVNVCSFSELHDFVDANCYGGFCVDNGITDQLIAMHGGRDADEGMPQGVHDFMNAAQAAIDAWIKGGKLGERINDASWEDFGPEAYGDLLRARKATHRLAERLLSKLDELQDAMEPADELQLVELRKEFQKL